ncbi:uncharacterized protein LOC131651499 [Vicia villosa]|uniref:uncharacterized protein LOC131651499 n=1 Tax=Vicia villosa TaxID=3911 RepID=UPI00273C408D|nr:uncharacterized protein LOC131651499 [Vicia villosa]
MEACNLSDLGTKGSLYTWRGPIFNGGQRIYERLDMAISNEDWRLMFTEAQVKVLNRVYYSYHHPIVVSLDNDFVEKIPKPFRFETKHSKEKYRGLIRLEKKLQEELKNILRQEELMWFQRSRTMWLVDDDRNTKYYHLKTVNRRRKNKIIMIKDDNGEWIDDSEKIKKHVNEKFQKLFSIGDKWSYWSQTMITFKSILEEELVKTGNNISKEEIRKVMFDMKSWKAPGPDGFPVGFCQKSRGVVGDTVCEFVSKM